MRFLIDANLPPLTAEWLRRERHEAVHVRDLGMRSALDPDIWRRAIQDSRILITKDADFAYLALSEAPGPQVVWIRCGNLMLAVYQLWLAAR